MASMAQLNVRMKPELKAAGDSVLDLYGISPSELIRTLWQKISLGKEALAQVADALAADPAAGTKKTSAQKPGTPSVASMIRERQECFEREMGLDPATYAPLSEDELEDLVYQDYLEKRRTSRAS